MELEGLCSNTSQLGEPAQEAVAYITLHPIARNVTRSSESAFELNKKSNFLMKHPGETSTGSIDRLSSAAMQDTNGRTAES